MDTNADLGGLGKTGKSSGSSLAAAYLVVILVLLIALGWVSWSYYQTRKELTLIKDPKAQQEVVKKEIDSITAALRKHILLPTGETPTVATIIDINALVKDQPFYTGAKNGDKLVVYEKAQKAIVYSPDRDLIVNVGPIFINPTDQQTQAAPAKAADTAKKAQ